jgi:hypothetical protein
MALYWTPRQKKGYHQIWEANLQPLGPICNPKIAQNWPQVFLTLTPSVKWALYQAGTPGLLLNNMPRAYGMCVRGLSWHIICGYFGLSCH